MRSARLAMTIWGFRLPETKNELRLKFVFVLLYYFTIWIFIERFFINRLLCGLQECIQRKILCKEIPLPFGVIKCLAF